MEVVAAFSRGEAWGIRGIDITGRWGGIISAIFFNSANLAELGLT
jgi:hypothetical protein